MRCPGCGAPTGETCTECQLREALQAITDLTARVERLEREQAYGRWAHNEKRSSGGDRP